MKQRRRYLHGQLEQLQLLTARRVQVHGLAGVLGDGVHDDLLAVGVLDHLAGLDDLHLATRRRDGLDDGHMTSTAATTVGTDLLVHGFGSVKNSTFSRAPMTNNGTRRGGGNGNADGTAAGTTVFVRTVRLSSEIDPDRINEYSLHAMRRSGNGNGRRRTARNGTEVTGRDHRERSTSGVHGAP